MGVRKKWSEREIKMLFKYFAWRGSKGVQELYKRRGFERTTGSIAVKAYRLGIDGYTPKGYTPISDIQPGWGLNHTTRAVRAAVADAVIERAAKTWVVPNWWADQYMEQIMQEHDEAVRVEGYVTLRDVAKFARMKVDTLRDQYYKKRGKGLVLHDYDVRLVRNPTRKYVIHPDVLHDPRLKL